MSGAIQSQRNRFVAFAFAAADLLLEVDSDGLVTFAAGASSQLLGRSVSEVMGTRITEILGTSGDLLVAHVLRSLKIGDRLDPIEIPLTRRDGSPQVALLRACRLPDGSEGTYFTLSSTSMSAPKTAGRRDSSSGLIIQEDFAASACEAAHFARDAGERSELTVLEVCGLGKLRKRLPSEKIGSFMDGLDRYLRTRSIGHVATRLGEDKYGFMHRSDLDVGALSRDIEEISRAADPEQLGVSVDRASIPVDAGLSDEDLTRAVAFTINRFATTKPADLGIESMTDALSKMVDETLDRIADFRRTIADGMATHVFQPIVTLADGGLHHSELLVRFEPGKSPQDIIGFAEDLRIIPELDIEICRAAIKLLKDNATAAPIAVNISAYSIENGAFVDTLMGMLRQMSFGDRLLFEITESVQLADLPSTNAVITRFRSLGHRVCLDDFGAGGSGFSYLQALDVDFVKFDGRYIRQVLEDDRSRIMLKAMAGLCHDLGVETVAEMIETESQAKMLRDLGIRFGQGYLFGKPCAELPTGRNQKLPPTATAPVSMNARARGAREMWG